MTRVPKSAQSMVAAAVRSIFEQATPEEVLSQHGRVVARLDQRFPQAAELLADPADDISAFTTFPKDNWR